MINNDVLRSIRFLLDLSDNKVVEFIQLANPEWRIDPVEVKPLLKKEEEEGHVPCPDALLLHFLDGLIIHCRGASPDAPPRPQPARMSNNVVLKKLRVAFELKDADMHQIFAEVGFPVSKPELSALFRQPDHRNFRLCGDQLLRNFLKGLTLRARGA